MLTRLAATLLSLALASTAGARSFSQPPPDVHAIRPSDDDVLDRATVRNALAARRAKNLAAFRAYRKTRVYPINDVRIGPLNVWRDAEGHLCAAATMIDQDGMHELVAKTAETNNFIRLLDVTEGPLLDWMMTSGLTLEEIDRIQLPMVRVEPPIDRAAETERLAKLYEETDRFLVKTEKKGLDTAVARLMTRPELARKLIADYAAQTTKLTSRPLT
jgi:hypothetical protein